MLEPICYMLYVHYSLYFIFCGLIWRLRRSFDGRGSSIVDRVTSHWDRLTHPSINLRLRLRLFRPSDVIVASFFVHLTESWCNSDVIWRHPFVFRFLCFRFSDWVALIGCWPQLRFDLTLLFFSNFFYFQIRIYFRFKSFLSDLESQTKFSRWKVSWWMM